MLLLQFAWLGGSRSSITPPRSSPATAKGARVEGGRVGGGGGLVLLPRDLNRVRSLSQLLGVLDPFIEGARGVGGGGGREVRAKDLAIALNHVKRLQWQVRVG
jgi:hypothetical protein